MIKNAKCRNHYKVAAFTFWFLFEDYIDQDGVFDWKRLTPSVIDGVLTKNNLDIDFSLLPLEA